MRRLMPALSPATTLMTKPPSVQSPFAQSRHYLDWEGVSRLLGEHYSSVFAHMDSCANPICGSPVLQHLLRSRSLRRLLPASAANGIFPTLSLRIFPRMLGPLPRRAHGVRLPVSSSMASAFPNRGNGSAYPLHPRTRFFAERFSRLQTLLYVQASEFARLPDRSYRCAIQPQGS